MGGRGKAVEAAAGGQNASIVQKYSPKKLSETIS